ncbi:hypothetical protein [Borrelia persica]|uniref:hypothetical protein n=1 Tax=Borrelia persica TaxID=44448 RepID=UPI000464F889|nr:hypothetical protein [Borrelia persica]
MIFKNKEKYNILFKSNLSMSDIAKVLDISESAVLKARRNILGEAVDDLCKMDAECDDNSSDTCLNVDLDGLVRDATSQAYRLEMERDSFHKSFYGTANSYIDSCLKYKQLVLNSSFKKLTDVNEEILNLEKEIDGTDDQNLCKKLKLNLRFKIYKRNRLSKKIILCEMKEDYECLLKLKEIFNFKGLKLG